MKKGILSVGLALLAFIIIDTLVLDNLLDKKAKTNEIKAILAKEINAKNISSTSANGLTLKSRIYGDSHFIHIDKSKFSKITKKEALFIQELFNNQLNNFKEADYIELNFDNINAKNQSIIFKKGKLIHF